MIKPFSAQTLLSIHTRKRPVKKFNHISLQYLKICCRFPLGSSQISKIKLTFTCSKPTIETLEKGVKYVKS